MRANYYLTKVPRKKHGVKSKANGVIWYCIINTPEGGVRRSTGQTVKARALRWCSEQERAGKLLPVKRNKALFKTFANGFFDENSTFVQQEKDNGRKTTKASYKAMAGRLKNHIMPYFENMRLIDITIPQIEGWMRKLKEKRLINDTINKCLLDLRKILRQGKKMGIIPQNPADEVKQFVYEKKKRKPLPEEQVKELLKQSSIETYWNNDLKMYYLNLVSCFTGMRESELLSLKPEDVEETHVKVLHSRNPYDGEKLPKNGRERIAPIPRTLFEILEDIFPEDGKYIFSEDGLTPFSSKDVLQTYYEAIQKMGITKTQIEDNGFCFHGWRHYFTSCLEKKNINNLKVKAIIGHSNSSDMTERYTHFEPTDFPEVIAVQEEMLASLGY